MNKKAVSVVCIFLLSLFLFSSCASTNKDLTTAEGLFAYAKEFDEAERYEVVLQKYADVKNKFPYSKLATDAELAIADVHFKRESFPEAEVSYQNFKDMHPKHAQIDYVVYKTGMSFYMQLPETIDRDLSLGVDALYHFRELIKKHPASQYSVDAKAKIEDIQNKQAQKELYIADFYFKNEKYSSALRRYENAIELFSEMGIAPKAHYGAAMSAKFLNEQGKFNLHKNSLVKKYAQSDEAKKIQGQGF